MSDEAATLAELVEAKACELGNARFLTFEDRELSFADLDQKSNAMANGLAMLGVGPGVGVAILMGNSPEWLLTFIGIEKLGAYAVPVNVALKGDGLRHVLDHSDASVVVLSCAYTEVFCAISDRLPRLRAVVVDESQAPRDWVRPKDWTPLAGLCDAPSSRPGSVIDSSAISTIMYTSGTTGSPKGVVSRYGDLNLAGIRALGGMLEADDVLYTCLPLFHANALWLTTIRALACDLPVVLSRRFSAGKFWDDMRLYGVTTFNALGAMVPILLKQPERSDDSDNPVRIVFSAACPASVWAEFERRFGVRIVEGYAAVDGGGFVVMNFGQSPKGSIGKPFNPYRIVDDEDHDVPAGEPGELLFKIDDAAHRKVEYYKDIAASQAKVSGGWFRSGDLVRADADGNLYFVDRKSDSVRRRGENISSWEVERVLNEHPAVMESAVFGVPSELGEDEVMAIVVPKEGCDLSAPDLVVFARERIASFMVPRFVEFRRELPKTETHRVRKAELKREGVGPRTWDLESPPTRDSAHASAEARPAEH
jgi:crotonobetaine/carnitine-CoA ligase